MNNSAKSRILALSLTTAITLATSANAAPENAATSSFGSRIVDAADFGDISKVQNLLSSGSSPNEKGDSGTTPLIRAVFHDNAELVNILLKSGANPDFADVGGATPLSIAAREGNNDVLDSLITAGANINLTDSEGYTPLMRASIAGNLEGAKSLIAAGAKLNLANNLGQTALAVAKKEGQVDIAGLLKTRGAKMTADAQGENAEITPLIKLRAGKSVEEKAAADDGSKADIVIDFSNGRLSNNGDRAYTRKQPLTEEGDYTMSSFSSPKITEVDGDKEILTNLSGNNIIAKEVIAEKADKNWLGNLNRVVDAGTPYEISDNEMVYKQGSQYNLLDLGNFKDEDFANKKIETLQKTFPDVFASLPLRVIKKGSGSSVFFQVNAGVIDNRDKATDICKKLIAAGTNCRPVETRLMSQDEFNKFTGEQPVAAAGQSIPNATPIPDNANKYPDKKDVLATAPLPAVAGQSLAPAVPQVAAKATTSGASNNVASLAPISEAGEDKFLPAVADMPAPKLVNAPTKTTTETVTKTVSVTPAAAPAKPVIAPTPAPVQIAQNTPAPAPKPIAAPTASAASADNVDDASDDEDDNSQQKPKKIEVTQEKKTETVVKKPDETKTTISTTETTKTIAVPPVPASIPSAPTAVATKSITQVTPPVSSAAPTPLAALPTAPAAKSTKDLPALPGTIPVASTPAPTPVAATETTTTVETKKTETKLVAHASDEDAAPVPAPEKVVKTEVKVVKSTQAANKVEVPAKPVTVAATPILPQGPTVIVKAEPVAKPKPEALHVGDLDEDAPLPVATATAPAQPPVDKFEVARPVKVTSEDTAPAPQFIKSDNVKSSPVAPSRELWAKVDSFNDQSTAQGFWNSLRAQNGLNGYRMRTVSPLHNSEKISAEIGPFNDASEAQQLCSLIATQGYSCKIQTTIPARFNDIISSNSVYGHHSDIPLTPLRSNYTAYHSYSIMNGDNPMAAAEPASGNTAWAIQLGSYETLEAAEAQWNFDSKKSRALKKLSKNIVSTDGKFRLQAGSFATADAADNLCSELRAKSLTCIMVRG